MNTELTTLILGLVALLSLAIAGVTFLNRQKAENDLRSRLGEASDKALHLPKLQGQIDELNRSADGLRLQLAEAQGKDSQREATIIDLTFKLSKVETELAAAKDNAQHLVETERKALQQVIQEKDQQTIEMRAFIEQSQEQLKSTFASAAAAGLSQMAKQFEEHTTGTFRLREQRLDEMVAPIKERLDSVLKRCESSDQEITKAKEAFEVQLRQLDTTTTGLVNALKRPDVRGDWGEMALQNALDSAGLKEGLHYVREHTTNDDDERRRADIVVSLPKGEKVVIDSKAPFNTYDEAMNADPSDRKASIQRHAKSLRGHISALAGKEYHARYQGPDFVIMFLPHEGMLLAAQEGDPSLIEFASERKVYIATPITLTAALGAIGHLLRVVQLNQNAEDIKKTGQELYASIGVFAEHYEKLGKRLGSAVQAYNDSVGSMERNLIGKARKLKDLGLAGKEIDSNTIEISPSVLSKPELTEHHHREESA